MVAGSSDEKPAGDSSVCMPYRHGWRVCRVNQPIDRTAKVRCGEVQDRAYRCTTNVHRRQNGLTLIRDVRSRCIPPVPPGQQHPTACWTAAEPMIRLASLLWRYVPDVRIPTQACASPASGGDPCSLTGRGLSNCVCVCVCFYLLFFLLRARPGKANGRWKWPTRIKDNMLNIPCLFFLLFFFQHFMKDTRLRFDVHYKIK